MARYKNPALSRVDGVLTAHCCICGKRLGDEYTESFYKLIRQKYCPDCAAKVEKENGVYRQDKFKQNRRKSMKEMRSFLDVYRRDIQIQKEYIAELERKLDDQKRGIDYESI